MTKYIEDKVEEFANEQIGVADRDGSYIYHLTRVKEAFAIGTMTLDDFEEIEDDDEWLVETKDWLRQALTETREEALREVVGMVKNENKKTMPDDSNGRLWCVKCGKNVINNLKQL